MLAKLGLTSPFNKRKIKELQSKQMALPQPQHQQPPALPATPPVSNIPMPKRIPVASGNLSSGLPIYHPNSNSSSESMNRQIKTAYVTSETRINNTNFNLNNTKLTLNTINTNTSISTTTGPALSCESTSNFETLSSLTTTSQMKPTTKLPQFSQQSTLIKDTKRKPALVKGVKSPIVQPQTTPQSNTQINSLNNANTCNISTLNSKPSISKLQPPTMIHSTPTSTTTPPTQATSHNTDSSDSTKTVKKFGLTSITSNSTTRTHSATSSSTSMSSNTASTSLNSSSQSSHTHLLQSKVIANSQASQLAAKKPSLSFGIPKFTTKLTGSSDTTALTSSSQSAIQAASPKPSQIPTNSQVQTSQIPSVSCSKIPSIGKLKTPSIQINSSVKTTNVTISSKTTPYAASTLSISPAKTTALTTPLNQRKLVSNEDNTDMKSTSFQNKSTTQQLNKLNKNEQLVKQQLAKNTLNEDLKSNDLSDNTKPDTNDSENRNECSGGVDDENDDKILGLDEENLVDDNDEEFQKFLNSDQIDSFNNTNIIQQQQQINLSRISKRISSNSNDLFIHLDTKPAPTISSPSPSSALSLTVSPKLISNNIKLHMSPPPHSPQLPPPYAQNILPSPPLPPPPPPPPAVQSNPPNLLLLTPTLQHFTPQHQQQQQQASNLLLKTTTNAVNLNTFGRSNTLDRKLKIPTSSNQLMLNLNNTNKPANKLANENESSLNTQQIYTNTLDRNFSQHQQQQHQRQLISANQASYSQSPHRNSLSISLKSPNTPSKMSHHFTTSHLHQSKLNYETIDENGTYLITSSASSNDIISISNNSSNSSSSSSTSSAASTIQQLKTELENARNRILTLTNQLNTNGQIVNTLEQSLSSLTFKLQKLSISSQKKDNLIIELKAYIEFLHSKYSKYFDTNDKQTFPLNSLLNRQNSTESINSLNSMFSQRSYQTVTTSTTNANDAADSKSVLSTPKKRTNWLRSSFKKAFNRKSSCSTDAQTSKPPTDLKKCLSDVDENDLAKQRLYDFDEFKQVNSSAYANIISNGGGDFSLPTSPLHQTILTQFKRSPISNNPISPSQCKTNSIISIGDELEEYQRLLRDKEIKLTDVRLEALATAHQLDQTKEENLKMRIELEQLRAENIRMQQYVNSCQSSSTSSQPPPISSSLSSPSPSSSISSSSHNSKINLSLSNSTQHVDMSTNSSSNCSIITNDIIKLNEDNSSSSSNSSNKLKISPSCCNIVDQINGEGKRVVVSIYLGDLDPLLFDPEDESFQAKQILIGSIGISTKTKWDTLDQMVKTLFKEYLTKLEADEIGSLGLSLDSLSSYYVGEMPRPADESIESQKLPDLLPYGYLVGNHTNIILQLKDVAHNSIDSLCFDTLVPKNVMQRYVSLILDHKNILFCGPTGTSKSYMARKIGEYLVRKQNKDTETSIAYFNAENKTCKELKQYLFNIIEHIALSSDKRNSSCSSHSSNEVPYVLILDNLNHIGNISEAFLEFFSPKNAHKKCSYVIGTVNQSDVTSLNLHQNFKWVLCVNHTEPVKNYLYRYLIRRLIDHEIKYQLRSVDLEKIIKWIPKLWQHVNKYIESYNSADLTIGPKIFSTFPMEFKLAQNWFIELWNNHLVPFLVETIKEGLQIYGTKTAWEDPKQWLTETMPWFHDFNAINSLYSIEADTVGIDSTPSDKKSTATKSDAENELDEDASNEYKCVYAKEKAFSHSNDNDKLLSMLMRLQEATLNQQTKTNCFNLNDLNGKQSASVETTLI